MSVTTTADEKLAVARQHIKDAIQALNEIVVLDCWGHDEFREEYRQRIAEGYHLAIDAKEKICW